MTLYFNVKLLTPGEILNNLAKKSGHVSPKLRSISTVRVQLRLQKNIRCIEGLGF